MHTKVFSRKQRFNTGFLAGLGAGIIATALMLILSTTVGGISLPEALGSALTEVTPSSIFEYLHRTIGGDAKHYLFYSILLGQFLVFALSGGVYNLVAGSGKSSRISDSEGRLSWLAGVILAVILWLLTGVVFLPATGAGIFGSLLSVGIVNSAVSLALVGLAFGLLFVLMQRWLTTRSLRTQRLEVQDSPPQTTPTTPTTQTTTSDSRRAILRGGLAVLGLGTLGVLAWRFISSAGSGSSALPATQLGQGLQKVAPTKPNYGSAFQSVPGLSPEVTSNNKFYVVSKNLFQDPSVNGATWNLTVNGLVEKPYTLNYNALMALPMKQQYETLECISNDVGGEYMSNALWEGIPLANLLKSAGAIKPGATKVVLYAADDYSDSIHLSKALEPTTLVAVRMNGVTLPQGHGYPARLLVPGIYGMKHVKWITRIEVTNQDYQGYWQQRGWSDPAPVRMTSRIDTPAADAVISANKPTYVAGVAFNGNQGISAVDVSFDGGRTWKRATLKQPLSAISWVLWEIPWTPTQTGTQTLVVRAIDLAGNVQDPQVQQPLPNGSSGYHNINVTIH